ncbi:DUF2868 domain-containing protein [Ectothiorhodospiraceae bacterium 2226]|nr:DUF2868 domain-containing protein [Ectothiorhodospiraceae bacterium 2226]
MSGRLKALLIAEALRRHPDARALLLDDTAGARRAREARGDDEHRLLQWVAHSAAAERFGAALAAVGWWLKFTLIVLLVVVFAGGYSTAASVLTRTGTTINIVEAMVALIGVQLALLLLWLVFLAASLAGRRRGGADWLTGGVIGHALAWLGTQSARRLAQLSLQERAAQTERRLAVSALREVLFRDGLDRWVLGAITHAAWLAFALGALLYSVVSLSVAQYDFVWGTTILADDAAARLILSLGWLPDALGLPAPDRALLEATRLGGEAPGAGRMAWGQFLIVALVVYALLPRLAFGLLCLLQAWRVARRLRLDQGHALFQEALLALRQAETAPPAGPAPTIPAPARAPRRAPLGRGDYFVLVGLELDEAGHWPPRGAQWRVVDAGHVGTRAEMAAALAGLRSLSTPPRFVLAVASMARSPDRGATVRLVDIGETAGAPLLLVLAESAAAQARGIDLAQRERDWRTAAGKAGVQAVRVLDTEALAALDQSALEQALRESGVG